MDLGLIRGSQWLLVLCHELAHAVDSDLAAALPVYNNDNTVAMIAKWGHQYESPLELPALDLITLDSWLIAGLHRGLLTEVRAWAITVSVYREGLASGLFERVEWMESLFGELQTPREELILTLSLLSPRFFDPVDGLFSLPLVQNRLKSVRQGLLEGRILFGGIR
ncbi:hypothetical protein WDW86_04425 [Bdellovibrionota bacterium FG-2]